MPEKAQHDHYRYGDTTSPEAYHLLPDQKQMRDIEASQIAADMSRIGALALATEAASAAQTGQDWQAEQSLDGLVSEEQLKIHRYFTEDLDSAATEHRPDAVFTVLNQELAEEKDKLEAVASGGADSEDIRRYFADKVRIARQSLDSPMAARQDQLLDALAVPPFLRAVKARHRYELSDGTTVQPGEATWDGFFETATEAQLANFAQWYAAELRDIATPEARAGEVARIKADYLAGIDGLIAQGVISRAVRTKVAKQVEKTDIFFRSPFRDQAENLGEYHQNGRFVIVTIGADTNTMHHELSHGIFGVDAAGISAMLDEISAEDRLSSEALIPAGAVVKQLIEEAAVSHLAQSIDEGSPGLMDPDVRAQNVQTNHFDGEEYAAYMKTTAMLLEGETGAGFIEPRTISEFYTALALGKFEDVAALVDRQWGEEGVMKNIVHHIATRLEAQPEGVSKQQLMAEVRDWLGAKQTRLAYTKTPMNDSHAA